MSSLNVLITGTSKGLGHDLVKIFAKKHPNSVIFATSRDKIKRPQQNWKSTDYKNAIKCRQLQICNSSSIDTFIREFSSQKIKLDIVVNNAGYADVKDNFNKITDINYAKRTLATNTLGTIELTKKLLPHLSQQCKIVNVSSMLGALDRQPKIVQDRFGSPSIKEQDILNGVKEYLEAAQKGQMENWYCHVYCTSKMFLNAWSRFILQKQWLKNKQKAICMSPGSCKTPMTANTVYRPPHEYSCYSGAVRIYQCAVGYEFDPQLFLPQRKTK